MIDVQQELADTLSLEIAREFYNKLNPGKHVEDKFLPQELAYSLIREKYPEATDEEAQKAWSLCEGNPYNATMLFAILRLA